jgi:hypothetical protein
MITLVLHEERKPIWRLLRETLLGEEGIELTQEMVQAFYGRTDLDALVLTRWVARERFRELPVDLPMNGSAGDTRVTEVEVISTRGQPSRVVAPWAIGIPMLPAHAVVDDSGQLDIVPDDPHLTGPEETYLIFTKVFETIERFNSTPVEPKIRRLGCDLDDIFQPVGKTEDEQRCDIQSVRQAYRDYRAHISG